MDETRVSRIILRVELISTGEATRPLPKQLVAFMVAVLRNKTVAEFRP